MLNVGGDRAGGARSGGAAAAPQQWQGSAADVEATGEALRGMLHIRGGAGGGPAVRGKRSSHACSDIARPKSAAVAVRHCNSTEPWWKDPGFL